MVLYLINFVSQRLFNETENINVFVGSFIVKLTPVLYVDLMDNIKQKY